MSSRGASNNILFSETLLCTNDVLKTVTADKEKTEAEQTLLAIRELTHYLQGVEKELSSMSKKMRKREIAQSVGFVGSGIHEALQYLTIVKKVIGKTERILDRKTPGSSQLPSEQRTRDAED